MVTPDDALPAEPNDRSQFRPTTPCWAPAGVPRRFPRIWKGVRRHGLLLGRRAADVRLPGCSPPQSATRAGTPRTPPHRGLHRPRHSENVLIVYDPASCRSTKSSRPSGRTTTRPRATARATTSAPSTDRPSTGRPGAEELARVSKREVPSGPDGQRPGPHHDGDRTGRRPGLYYAEPEHQQYLEKNPHGYDCHANTGTPARPLISRPTRQAPDPDTSTDTRRSMALLVDGAPSLAS